MGFFLNHATYIGHGHKFGKHIMHDANLEMTQIL